MKKILAILAMTLILGACSQKDKGLEEGKEIQNQIVEPSLSNMADEDSQKFVKNTLKDKINPDRVNSFMKLVKDYNEAVGNDLLVDGFIKDINKTYDTGKIIEKRDGKDLVDTNCRINAFLLSGDELTNKNQTEIDDSMLFTDLDMIKKGKIFNDDETFKFKEFFTSIPTESSKDPAVQGKIAEKYYQNWTYPEKFDLVSVMIHDKLDGDKLFIGHIGVLTEIDGGYLFVEKISFEEPYQAIKFPTKDACYKYLQDKFKDFIDPEAAPPFIMDNGKYIE
ncbi:DUF4300 family protein [Anaerococcus sp. NML200537]|uniref:DUF4300 family protein n=1 Tax=Anaerococcus kampingae TaxID=3115614 RepID=A0ABW9MD35_9FIRM|nr:DUF4300 family protein [Anaerococcus sp. NML200537]MCW6701875.1 DUF4300 family protein [Anaerococcus sp. NML200537]